MLVEGLLWPIEEESEQEQQATLSPWQQRELNYLLETYAEVFKEPTGHPPERSFAHSIVLQLGAGPDSVRPYRYPHYQKDGIERQITNMLEQGIIWNSTSSFSSSVILVQKKDETWRMCIDYRALNKVTIQSIIYQ